VLVMCWIPLIVGFIALMGLWLMPLTAEGRDLDGRYANSPLKPWFDQLKSRNGACCSDADGYVVEDADWEAKNGHYRVRVPEYPDSKVMVWIDVPDNSIITEHTRLGGPWSGRHILALQRRRTRGITYGSAALCQGA